MAFVIKDRVRETTTTTGTSAISLGGTSTSFEAFSDHMSNADTTHYAIVHSTADEWEVGLGTWNTGNTLTRTTVLSSSNSNAAVSFTSGSKDVFMTYPASQSVSNLPLSGGTMTGDVLHGDNIKAKFGTGNDLEIYHDGSHSVIHDVGEGHLKLLGQDLIIAKESSGVFNHEYYIYCDTDGSVFLYYDGSAVMGTVSDGISVIGDITVSGDVDGRDVAADGTKLDAIEANATADQTKSDIDALGINASSVSGFTVGVSVPSNALFTDTNTTYSVGDGGLTQKNFTTTLKTKLDGIESGATADQTKSDIDALGINATSVSGFTVGKSVPSNAVFTDTTYSIGDGGLTTNDFTNADHTKLNGIATGATAYTNANAVSAVTASDLDMDGNKVLFSNMYSTLNDLPSATDNHGMFAHVHATGKGYFAHGGNWIELANASDVTTYTHPNHSGEVTSTGDGATVIADNVVDEANLKVSNTPTNGYVLTAQSGNTGGLTWAAASGGGSSTLDGLSDVSTSGVTSGQVLKYNGTNWTPASDNTGSGGGGITTGKAIAMAMVFG